MAESVSKIKEKLITYIQFTIQLRMALAPVILAYKAGDLSKVSKRQWDHLIECFDHDPAKGKKLPNVIDLGSPDGRN